MPQQIQLLTSKQRKRAAVRAKMRETAKRRRRTKAKLVGKRAVQGPAEARIFGPGAPTGKTWTEDIFD